MIVFLLFMEKKLLGLALVFVVALGAGCETSVNTTSTTEVESDAPQGIAEGEPNPAAPTEDETTDEDGTILDIDAGVDVDAEAEVKTFTVDGTSFAFAPSTINVKKGDTVRIVFNNKAGFHDWVLDEFNAKTKQISAGTTETIEFVADKAGEFEYYCSVGSHRQMGMVGTLVVEE